LGPLFPRPFDLCLHFPLLPGTSRPSLHLSLPPFFFSLVPFSRPLLPQCSMANSKPSCPPPLALCFFWPCLANAFFFFFFFCLPHRRHMFLTFALSSPPCPLFSLLDAPTGITLRDDRLSFGASFKLSFFYLDHQLHFFPFRFVQPAFLRARRLLLGSPVFLTPTSSPPRTNPFFFTLCLWFRFGLRPPAVTSNVASLFADRMLAHTNVLSLFPPPTPTFSPFGPLLFTVNYFHLCGCFVRMDSPPRDPPWKFFFWLVADTLFVRMWPPPPLCGLVTFPYS